MKNKSRSVIAMCITILCLSVLSSGCSTMQERRWDGCAVAGAIIGGATGAGLGLGISNAVTRHGDNVVREERGTATWAGGLAGAALGATVGHYFCDPVIAKASELPPAPPPAPLPPPPPPPPPTRERIVLRGVHFDFKKAEIRPESEPILDEAADALQKHPNMTIYVDGYCDIIGSEEANLILSRRRAEAVAGYLERKGISASRLVPRGFGKTNFVASNDNDAGRAQNRRVELVPTGP